MSPCLTAMEVWHHRLLPWWCFPFSWPQSINKVVSLYVPLIAYFDVYTSFTSPGIGRVLVWGQLWVVGWSQFLNQLIDLIWTLDLQSIAIDFDLIGLVFQHHSPWPLYRTIFHCTKPVLITLFVDDRACNNSSAGISNWSLMVYFTTLNFCFINVLSDKCFLKDKDIPYKSSQKRCWLSCVSRYQTL